MLHHLDLHVANRARLAEEVRKLKATKRFGLVFEEHIPETVRLPGLGGVSLARRCASGVLA